MGAKKKVLTAEEFLANVKMKDVPFEVPELGGIISLRGFTKDIQAQIRKNAIHGEEFNQELLEDGMFKAGVIDPEFTDEQIAQIRQTIPAVVFDRIILKIAALSGLNKEDSAAAETQFLS